MTAQRFHKLLVLLVPPLVCVQGCGEANTAEVVNVSLKNTETYQYPAGDGDEEGARLSSQSNHSSISEIRRNAETDWAVVYVYRPVAGFVGSDSAAIEILTGSDGTSAPTGIKRVAFHFAIHD
jgi:hypothetical protein